MSAGGDDHILLDRVFHESNLAPDFAETSQSPGDAFLIVNRPSFPLCVVSMTVKGGWFHRRRDVPTNARSAFVALRIPAARDAGATTVMHPGVSSHRS